jgi:carbon monoxide dehydrogenase subunit G
MAERTEGSIDVDATPEEVMEVLLDFEAYPQWSDIRSTTVVKQDSKGRGKEVAFEIKAPMIGDVSYTLTYTYARANGGLSWTTKEIEGGIRDIEGEYELEELEDGTTRVTYRMAIELAMKVPGFLRKQGEKQIVKQALEGLKKRVEQG